MAGIHIIEKLIKEGKDKGIVKSIFEQEDQDERNKKYFEYVIETESGENIKINDYDSDIRCSKNIKEGDSVELKILGEDEAILLKEGEKYSEKDIYKTIRHSEDYLIDKDIEWKCCESEVKIEKEIRKIEKLRKEKIISIRTYNGDILIDGKEVEGTKCSVYFEGEDDYVDKLGGIIDPSEKDN